MLYSSDTQTPATEKIQSEMYLWFWLKWFWRAKIIDQTCDIQLALVRYHFLTVSVAVLWMQPA